ncbi:ergothioneine biosynthesis glutamate--cysteine ligase EgtA [Streptomyces sp. NPDC049954]|uniref:ergothioneine biosynthesis glutamate--cysteine ligase EgtA n=1 Tax=Streptomyces sp. NPDC049954 TaxID=3155779 RepID=UPI003442D2DE
MTDEEAVTEADLEALVRGICFKTGPPRAVGVELEWLVHAPDRPSLPLTPGLLRTVLARLRGLPLRAPLTVEPGGQLEISSLPAPSLTACVEEVQADLRLVRAALELFGLALTGLGTDPWRGPRRMLREPRYDAMEQYLDRAGAAGRNMMCCSASVQVCLDAGHEEPGPLGLGHRWRLAHLLGPVLVAAFANSPYLGGRRTGWRSTRQALWADIEPGRSAAPPVTDRPHEAWAAHVLDTPVMCVRSESGPWPVPEGLTLREWARTGRHRPTTRQDLEYHITTLFPPVRPRGHLELRMIDAQRGPDGWVVPLAVTTALFDDPEATETAARAVKPLAERLGPEAPPRGRLWQDAARDALHDPELREAARTCFAAAAEALPRLGASTAVTDAVAAFADRYVERGRCPADDLLDLSPEELASPPGLWADRAPAHPTTQRRKDVLS